MATEKTQSRFGKRRWKLWLGLLAFGLFLGFLAFEGFFNARQTIVGERLKPMATLTIDSLGEASGLVQSLAYPDALWVHNDSGNEPSLFLIDKEGKSLIENSKGMTVTGSALVDWEDIARSGDRLFVADMGNNFQLRSDLGVYEIVEPDDLSGKAAAIKYYPILYPDKTGTPPTDRWEFDCEAIFSVDKKLYFVTKNRPAFRQFVQMPTANLYRLDNPDPNRHNVLKRIDQIDGLEGWVTAADVSADSRYLAVLCESPVQSIWLFERPTQGDKWFTEANSVHRYVFHGGGQLESIAFFRKDGQDSLIMLNEESEMFEIPLEKFKPVGD